MARLGIRTLLARSAVAWAYLIAVVIAGIVQAALSPHDRAALLRWASTNVVNLRHDPVGSLVASAFFAAGSDVTSAKKSSSVRLVMCPEL